MLQLPQSVGIALELLEAQGHVAYAVGGCVRDSLLGRTPKDWDVATSALPHQVLGVFSAYRTIETGLQHGTVTVILGDMPIEITTFRVDGPYLDSRHPQAVAFTHSLRADLARRDFTINAMAYHPKEGVIDYFEGIQDLECRLIRCVGDPDDRFEEDALRIARALRFSAVLGFSIEQATGAALRRQAHRLSHIAAERIQTELVKLLCAPDPVEVLLEYSPVLGQIIPELLPTMGFEQNNDHHIYPVYEHMVHSVPHVPPQPHLRLAMFLHDIGKPECYTVDEQGIGHFYGHMEAGERIVHRILSRLRVDGDTLHRVCLLIRYHDVRIPPDRRALRRWVNRIGMQALKDLLFIKTGDCMAQNPDRRSRLKDLETLRSILMQIEAEGLCCTRAQLAINGNDLAALGLPPGRETGRVLGLLLDEVIAETLTNQREALLQRASELISKSV